MHLIDELMEAGFDIGASKCLPEGEGEGHAIAYVHRRVMDPTKPVAAVPIFLNTYFPPNQPRPRRCYEFGQAIRKVVESFPGEARVGVLASGGLSHFLVDEDFDRAILKACADKDAQFLKTPAAQQAACRHRRKSSTGWRSQARSSTSTSTGSNMCPAIERPPEPAPD